MADDITRAMEKEFARIEASMKEQSASQAGTLSKVTLHPLPEFDSPQEGIYDEIHELIVSGKKVLLDASDEFNMNSFRTSWYRYRKLNPIITARMTLNIETLPEGIRISAEVKRKTKPFTILRVED